MGVLVASQLGKTLSKELAFCAALRLFPGDYEYGQPFSTPCRRLGRSGSIRQRHARAHDR